MTAWGGVLPAGRRHEGTGVLGGICGLLLDPVFLSRAHCPSGEIPCSPLFPESPGRFHGDTHWEPRRSQYSSLPLKSQELQEPDPADDTFRNSTQTSSRNQQIWRCGRAWKGLIQRPKRAFSPHLSHFPHPPFGLYMTGVSSCAGNAIPRQLHLYSYPVGQKGLMLPL